MPKLSFVVSTCDRPGMLPIVLHSLAVQTFTDFEVIVTDNSPTIAMSFLNNKCVDDLADRRFRYTITSGRDCYFSAEWAVKHECKGEFLCFPSDDSYYVPCFAEIMLKAADLNRWGLVYCNMVYDARFNGQHYAVVNVQPMVNSIDKTGFMMKRSWFEGFPGKVESGPCKADGELIESLIERGIQHGKVHDVMVVHN